MRRTRNILLFLVILAPMLSSCSQEMNESVEIHLIKKTEDRSTATAHAIQAEMKQDAALKNYDVNITVTERGTTLGGQVASEGERVRIEEIARHHTFSGRVTNAITILTPKSDDEVSFRVRSALAANQIPDVQTIGITTTAGIVHLTGMRNTPEEVDRILAIALNVQDVKDVKSEFTILNPEGNTEPY